MIGARAAATGIGIVSAVTEMPQGDAPPRRPPCSTCPPRCVLPFLFCCLLIDRVATVRSVDFAAEESVVAPPGGAPGTPAGYCWLLDVSLRRMARSGWTCGVAMTTMTRRTRTLVAVATSTAPSLFFFRAGAEGRRRGGGAPAGRRGRVRGEGQGMYESVATMFFSRTLC